MAKAVGDRCGNYVAACDHCRVQAKRSVTAVGDIEIAACGRWSDLSKRHATAVVFTSSKLFVKSMVF